MLGQNDEKCKKWIMCGFDSQCTDMFMSCETNLSCEQKNPVFSPTELSGILQCHLKITNVCRMDFAPDHVHSVMQVGSESWDFAHRGISCI